MLRSSGRRCGADRLAGAALPRSHAGLEIRSVCSSAVRSGVCADSRVDCDGELTGLGAVPGTRGGRSGIRCPGPPRPASPAPGVVRSASRPPWSGLGEVASIPPARAPSLNLTSVPGTSETDDPTIRASSAGTGRRPGRDRGRSAPGHARVCSSHTRCGSPAPSSWRRPGGRRHGRPAWGCWPGPSPGRRPAWRGPASSWPLELGRTTEAAANGVASSRRTAKDSGKGRIACTLPGTSCSSTGTVMVEPTATVRRSTGRIAPGSTYRRAPRWSCP